MKISREQVQANRARILAAAGRLFREFGLEGVSVADVMREAGLTHGGFYNHFASKDALVAAMLAQDADMQDLSPSDFADAYLSAAHRDERGRACVFSCLGTEAGRLPAPAREALTVEMDHRIAQLAEGATGADDAARRQAAITAWSAMVGAMVLARIATDPALSDEILAAARAGLPLESQP